MLEISRSLLNRNRLFFVSFLAGIGKKMYLCSRISSKNLPIEDMMEYISVIQFAEMHGISERTVRNYCSGGKIEGAFLTGKTWNIPADAVLPKRGSAREKVSPLLKTLREQKASRLKGGIYHRTQIDLTYNSNHMEGSRLTHDQTRFIYETNTIGISDTSVNVDDIVETINHFRCIDFIIDHAEERLTEGLVKQLHLLLKSGTSDSLKDWFAVGDYKKLPNEVAGEKTSLPQEVSSHMKTLLSGYVRFERIHPFQDGNGRVGRLLMFKECLANGVVPFIITDELKMFYYRGLREWGHINGYLMDTCLTAQDAYKELLDYFKVSL